MFTWAKNQIKIRLEILAPSYEANLNEIKLKCDVEINVSGSCVSMHRLNIYLYIFSLIYRRHEIIAISIVEAIFTAQININKHAAHLKSTICYAGSCVTTCYAYAVYASLFLARY